MSESYGGGATTERRARFRVSDQVLLDYEPIDETEAARRRAHLHEALPSAFAVASELHEMRQESVLLRGRAEQESSAFAQLIDMLDRKIERLAEVLMIHELGSRRPQRMEVDISTDGMGLAVDTPLPVGTILDMRMMLPSTGLGLRTFAHVIHCGELRDGSFRMGVRFDFLGQHDRELMVHHVRQRESSLLHDRHQQEPRG